ncbi:MAG: methionine ABC transporter ATP-binding protein [Gammaproteobacteria bacterium]|jgi:D-methionine transport system ATP-binding protein|nr:methionine ABC transporter ATP-binding protein [Gammaproteobacteria bacterium]
MISIRNLSKYYEIHHKKIPALKHVNLDVKPGEIYGIIGRSGAGKSTLIRCVNMLERPSEGNIYIEGTCVTEMGSAQLREARRQMGMIFQHFNLLQSRNVVDNIALPLELAGLSTDKIKTRVDELLGLTELSNHAKQYPSQLSGGQKQRVAIARALAYSPKVLLCDEATSSLDPQSTMSILELLRSINHELGITILLITHEMDVVKTICHRVGVIHQGEIIEQRNVIELFTDPHTQVAKDLVKASSRMEIPRVIKEMLQSSGDHDSGTIIRIAYHGESASQPIIGYLIQQYRININILQGNIETIQDQIVGVMIVEIKGDRTSVEKSISFLERNGLHVEILGYVQRDP